MTGESPQTQTPPPGTPIGQALEYHCGQDRRLVLLEGKNPGINGIGWQTRCSSDLGDMLRHLGALGPRAARVTGIGWLQDSYVTFDVDDRSLLNQELRAILLRGCVNTTRPGRAHSTWRVPDGRRVGSSTVKLDEAFPPGGWGELIGWNKQIRCWGPGPEGTHCAHQFAQPIPMLPEQLLELTVEPLLRTGDPLSEGATHDWLSEHDEALRHYWLDADVARFSLWDRRPKHERVVSRTWHLIHNVAAGAYPGWEAFNRGLVAYRAMCDAEGDWQPDNERKYTHMWKAGIGKITTDPAEIAAVEAKRDEIRRGSLAHIPWDPDNDPADASLAETYEILMAASGYTPQDRPQAREISEAEIVEMLHAAEASDV